MHCCSEMLHGTSSSRPGTLANVAAFTAGSDRLHDEHRCRFALLIAGGVAAIIAGAGIGNLSDSDNSILGVTPLNDFLTFLGICVGVIIGLAMLIPGGMSHTDFKRRHPYVEDFMLRDVALGTELPRAGKSLRVGSFCRSRKTSAATSRTAMESTPSEALPVRGRGGGHQEGADDRGGLAEDIVEAVVPVGVILGDDLAVVLSRRAPGCRPGTCRPESPESRTPRPTSGKNAAKNTMHIDATTAAVIITLVPNRPAKTTVENRAGKATNCVTSSATTSWVESMPSSAP